MHSLENDAYGMPQTTPDLLGAHVITLSRERKSLEVTS